MGNSKEVKKKLTMILINECAIPTFRKFMGFLSRKLKKLFRK